MAVKQRRGEATVDARGRPITPVRYARCRLPSFLTHSVNGDLVEVRVRFVELVHVCWIQEITE
jgi:hypothetical protein